MKTILTFYSTLFNPHDTLGKFIEEVHMIWLGIKIKVFEEEGFWDMIAFESDHQAWS